MLIEHFSLDVTSEYRFKIGDFPLTVDTGVQVEGVAPNNYSLVFKINDLGFDKKYR